MLDLLPQPGGFKGAASAGETLHPDDPSVAKCHHVPDRLLGMSFAALAPASAHPGDEHPVAGGSNVGNGNTQPLDVLLEFRPEPLQPPTSAIDACIREPTGRLPLRFGAKSASQASRSPRLKASIERRTISTFSSDIARSVSRCQTARLATAVG
jgi:hypothetical protein